MTIVFPSDLRARMDSALKVRGYSLDQPAKLAQAVMGLSDFYAKNPSKQTPWFEPATQAAYLAYYLPLNWWRMMTAVQRGLEVDFFAGLEHVIDFGSGLGSATFAMFEQDVSFVNGGTCVERSKEAIAMHKDLHADASLKLSWQTQTPEMRSIPKNTLAVFSYSLTELSELPSWTKACEALMIVEPATQDDGRKLLLTRQKLIDDGWYIVAPCTHQGKCPLLTASERDWCHDRCQWTQPDWLAEMERHMPIKNGTLPFSYLLARRSGNISHGDSLRGRMTGDLQEFKGFAKQLFCRSDEREFIAWQKRDFKKEYPTIPRGTLVRLQDGLVKKGNEIRATSEESITSS